MRSDSGTGLHGRCPSRDRGWVFCVPGSIVSSGSCLGQQPSEQHEPQSCFTAQPHAVTFPQVTQPRSQTRRVRFDAVSSPGRLSLLACLHSVCLHNRDARHPYPSTAPRRLKMTESVRPGFHHSPLEFVERVPLRYGSPPATAALAELPRGVAEPVHEVLNLLWLFGSIANGGGGGRAWFDPAQLRVLEEELLTSALDEGLRSALAVIVGELVRPNRRTATLPQACAAAAEWALSADARETAIAFIELAALCRPRSGRLALIAGRTLKNYGKLREAESWLRRSGKLSHWGKDWETLVLSQSSLGMLYWSQGGSVRAERHLLRALRFAKRYHLGAEVGVVNHELFVVRVTSDRYDGVEAFAQAAFEHYLPNHPRLPHLAYDLAYYWLMRGYAHRAAPLLQKLVPHFTAPAQRVQVLSALARAAGATGDRTTFDAAMLDARPILADPATQTTRAAALIDFGFGACNFGLWAEAEACFSEAARAAEAEGQHDMLIRADTCLKSVARAENPDTPARPQAVAAHQTGSEHLAAACLVALAEMG